MAEATCDVAVVGAGLVGASLAYELGRAGVDVLLVDGAHPGRASAAGAGILSPETTWKPDDHWFAFGLAAAAHYRSLVPALAELGAPETAYAACGLLLVALDPGEDDWFTTRADLALRRPSAAGADGRPGAVHEVTPDEARALFPLLGEVRRVLHNPAAARVDGRKMTAAVLHGADRHGVRRRTATATGLRSDGDRVTGVDTDTGFVSCGAVAVAGGAWTEALGRPLGVALPVGPVKGQIVHLQLPEPDGATSAAWPIVSPVLNHYLVAWPGGRVACGGTYEADAGFDVRPTVAGLIELLRAAVAIAPGLGRADVAETRVGLRPVSADDAPLLGPVPGCENLHVATGHGTEGLLLGPYSAALVARELRGDGPLEELAPFRPDRFAS